MILAFRLLLARLNPAVLRAVGVIAALLLLLASLLSLALRSCQQRRLASQQNQADQLHTAQQASEQRRYTRFQLDSTTHATKRQQLLRDAAILEKLDEELSAQRPDLVPLPVSPPRE